MEATCSHPVAEVTVFSKQRARRRLRTRWPWATSTRQAWRMGRKTLAPYSLRGGSSHPTRRTSQLNFTDNRVAADCGVPRSTSTSSSRSSAPVQARSSSICSTALASDVEAGTTLTHSGRPVTSTQTMRLAPLVRPPGPPWLWKVAPPFDAPRARWVSMTTIEGRGSLRPRAMRDEACSATRTRVHVPFLDHRRNWDQILVHGPNPSGR